jgi:hypothetical protein
LFWLSAAADVAAAARHLLKKNSFFLSFPVDSVCNDCYLYKYRRRANAMTYKYEEIKEHFVDWMKDQDAEWLKDNKDDWHHHAFNMDYFIIGTHNAIEWMGDQVFKIIETIKEYEQDNFGEVTTDLSSPENLVNMYAYIVGEQVVDEWR